MRQESGFTLIELVVVIVILGILAAFAVPRFLGVQTEARISSLQGLQGSILGAVTLVYGKALASGNSTIPAKAVVGSSEGIDTIGNGTGDQGVFPAANSTGIVEALQDTSGFKTTNGTDGPAGDWSDWGLAGTDAENIDSGGDTDKFIIFYPEGLDDAAPVECALGYQVNSTDYAVSIATDDC